MDNPRRRISTREPAGGGSEHLTIKPVDEALAMLTSVQPSALRRWALPNIILRSARGLDRKNIRPEYSYQLKIMERRRKEDVHHVAGERRNRSVRSLQV